MKTRFIVIGLAACFLTAAFLGHFWKEFIATNHINDYHIGQYLDGGGVSAYNLFHQPLVWQEQGGTKKYVGYRRHRYRILQPLW